MPILAIGAAIGSLAFGGATAIGAVLGGSMAIADIAGAVGAVGATLGAVGAVTHDKTLSTIGTVLGGIGGVGALAINAGVIGGSADLFGNDISTVASSPMNAAFDPALDDVSSTPMNAAFTTDAAGNPDIISSLNMSPVVTSMPLGPIPGSMVTPAGDVTTLAPVPDPMASTTAAAEAPDPTKGLTAAAPSTSVDTSFIAGEKPSIPAASASASSEPASGGAVPDVKIPGSKYVGQDGVTYISDGSKYNPQLGFFDSLMKSPFAQFGMVQAAGSVIGGALDTLKPAQIDALSAQAAANRAATSLQTAQNANISAPLPVAKRVASAPVTGTPTVQPGIINSAPAVTGQVAA